MRTNSLAVALGIALGLALSSAASAQMAVNRLDHPVSEQLRARAESLVRALRPHDAEDALAKLKTAEGAAIDAGWVVLRIEADCVGERCMTIVARIDADRMMDELVLIAGKNVVVGDHAVDFWGVPSWVISFEGMGNTTISAIRRDGRWIVGSCSDCFPWGDLGAPASSVRPASPPSPPPEPENLETFRRALGLDAG